MLNRFKLHKKYNIIKNILYQTIIDDNLYVIWYYHNMFHGLKKDEFYSKSKNIIGVDLKSNGDYGKVELKSKLFYSLKILREIIIFSSESKNKYTLKSFYDYKWFSYFHNSYKIFEDYITIPNKNDCSSIIKFQQNVLHQLSHEQFEFQKLENSSLLYISLYYDIYKEIKEEIFLSRIGLNLNDIFTIGLLFYFIYQSDFKIKMDYLNSLIYKDKIKLFLDFFSLDFYELKKNLIIANNYFDPNLFRDYGKTDLLKYPICSKDGLLFSFLPKLILFRISNFVYFDIMIGNKFGDLFGKANQKMIKNLLNKLTDNKINLIDIDIVDNDNNKKIDFILKHENFAFFIECKSNSICLESKQNGLTDKDKNRIAENIYQLYKYIILYKLGKKVYNNLKFTEGLIIVPILSYIYNPYLSLGGYKNEVISLAKKLLIDDIELNDKIDLQYIENIFDDLHLFIIDNMEYVLLIDIINNIGIDIFYKELSILQFSKSNTKGLEDLGQIISQVYEKYKIDKNNAFYNDKKILDLLKPILGNQ